MEGQTDSIIIIIIISQSFCTLYTRVS